MTDGLVTPEKIDTSDERKALDTILPRDDKKPEDKKEPIEDDEEPKDDDKGDEGEIQDEDKDNEEEQTEEGNEEEDDEDAEGNEEESDSIYNKIKALDPSILKKIPELRSVIFREAQYTELFSTVEEAKESKGRSEVFQDFENEIRSGSSKTILTALKGTNEKELESFVANFIPTVREVSKDLYLEMLYPEFKKMLQAAVASGDKRLIVSAQNLNHFIWNNTDVDAKAGLEQSKKDPKEEEFSKREKEFEQRQYQSFSKDAADTVERRFKNIIGAPFKDADLAPLLRRSLTDEIYKRIDAELVKDVRHQGNMKNLWLKAKKDGFTTESKDSLINAYLSRGRVLISKYRQEVLAENKVSIKAGTDDKPKKKPIRLTGQEGGGGKDTGKIDLKKVDWNKTTERDIIDGKVTYKG